MDEISAIIEKAPFIHGDIPRDLFHPGFIRMLRDSSNLNLAALQTDKEQYVVSDQPMQR
jgi:hypothetical protein